VRTTATKKSNRQSGYGLIFAAIGMVALLGAAGLSVDIGYLRYQRRQMQSAADSAALAGAAQLGAGGGTAQAVIAARSDSQLNGFQDGDGNIVVTPTRTSINGNTDTMQVQVTNTYPTFFMRVFGAALRTATISTTATAQYLGGRGCIYALTGGTGITLSGGGSINTPNCNVISNQSISGRGAITAAAVGAHNRSIGSTPPAITGTLQATDPLSYLTAPAAGGCTDINYGNDHAGTQILAPGTYSEIVLQPRIPGRRGTPATPANNSNITFRPGTYVINGCAGGGKSGGLDLEGNGTLTGTAGVTFYIARGGVTIANTQTIHLNAPSNNPYAGILMFQPTSNTSPAAITGNGGGSYVEGALYFPNATLNLAGAANNARNGKIDYMVLVAKSLNITTTVNFTSDYGSLPNGYSPVRSTAIVQ
jgi:Flp pilus assembly protein TadG